MIIHRLYYKYLTCAACTYNDEYLYLFSKVSSAPCLEMLFI